MGLSCNDVLVPVWAGCKKSCKLNIWMSLGFAWICFIFGSWLAIYYWHGSLKGKGHAYRHTFVRIFLLALTNKL